MTKNKINEFNVSSLLKNFFSKVDNEPPAKLVYAPAHMIYPGPDGSYNASIKYIVSYCGEKEHIADVNVTLKKNVVSDWSYGHK